MESVRRSFPHQQHSCISGVRGWPPASLAAFLWDSSTSLLFQGKAFRAFTFWATRPTIERCSMLFIALILLVVVIIVGIIPTARAILYAKSDQYKVDQRLDAVSR
jgi:hypothetical protein